MDAQIAVDNACYGSNGVENTDKVDGDIGVGAPVKPVNKTGNICQSQRQNTLVALQDFIREVSRGGGSSTEANNIELDSFDLSFWVA